MLEIHLALVLGGAGLGMAAAAWATRRPEVVARIGPDVIDLGPDPTPQQVEIFRARWHELVSTDPVGSRG